MPKYPDGFKCDKQAKEILKHLIENVWFSSCTIIYDEQNDNNPMAHIDTIFTAITKSNNKYKYAIELKERKDYTHNQYDWMIELDKYQHLSNYQNLSGYTTAYVNMFKDNIYALWTFNNIENIKQNSTVYTKHTTQGTDTKKYNKKCYLLSFNNANLTGYTNDNL